MLGVIAIVAILACVQALPADVELRNITLIRDINNRIKQDGYHSESHFVVTSDGYILEMIRIPNGRFEYENSGNVSRPVVFLMHGLQSSAVSFITLGSEKSMGYNLADNGFDVWMGNARGVINSRNHLYLNPDNPKDRNAFFDYTFDDIGTKDLPAMIDFVLKHTNQPQLHYIGHSQGGTAFLVLNSLLPEYNSKITSAHLLAGVGYQNYFPNEAVHLVANQTDGIYRFAVRWGLLEIIGPEIVGLDTEACTNGNDENACNLITMLQEMGDVLSVWELLAGASIKQYAHYGQNIKDSAFRRWDYGTLGNLFRYNLRVPPSYNIRRITADVTMHYTLGDIILDEKDVMAMAFVMPNARTRRVARESFSHTDFLTSMDAKELVTDFIIEQLKKYD